MSKIIIKRIWFSEFYYKKIVINNKPNIVDLEYKETIDYFKVDKISKLALHHRKNKPASYYSNESFKNLFWKNKNDYHRIDGACFVEIKNNIIKSNIWAYKNIFMHEQEYWNR